MNGNQNQSLVGSSSTLKTGIKIEAALDGRARITEGMEAGTAMTA
jgi:hypothetical protein